MQGDAVEVIDFILEGGPTLGGAGPVGGSHTPGPRVRSRAPSAGGAEIGRLHLPRPLSQDEDKDLEATGAAG